MTPKERDAIWNYVNGISSKLAIKGVTQDTITVAIIACDKEEFDDALYDVKCIEGRRYNPTTKNWTIPRPKETLI